MRMFPNTERATPTVILASSLTFVVVVVVVVLLCGRVERREGQGVERFAVPPSIMLFLFLVELEERGKELSRILISMGPLFNNSV